MRHVMALEMPLESAIRSAISSPSDGGVARADELEPAEVCDGAGGVVQHLDCAMLCPELQVN